MLQHRQISKAYVKLDFYSLLRMVPLLFLICFCVAYPVVAEAEAPVGKVTEVEGQVDIMRGGTLPASPVKVGDAVFLKDIIRTKSGSKATISFIDGNSLKIAQRSRINISEYIADDPLGKRIINMSRGKVEATVTKLDKKLQLAPGAQRFEIRTPNAVAGVRGTQYIVIYDGDVSIIVVISGTVYVANPANPDEVVAVHAGYSTTVSGDDPPTTPTEFTPEELLMYREYITGDDYLGDTTGSTTGGIHAYYIETSTLPGPPFPPPPPPGYFSDPVLETVLTPNMLTNNSTASFEFTINEASIFQYNLDNGGWVTVPGFLTVFPLIINPIAEGDHTIVVRATDAVGNTVTTSYSWTTDYTPPVISGLTGPGLTNSNTATIGFSGSDLTPITYSYMLDGVPVPDTNLSGLTEGSHAFVISATDSAGNSSSATYNWTTDYTAPVISGLTGPGLTNVNTATIGFSGSDASPITYSYMLDGVPVPDPNLSGLTEGGHAFVITATDGAGNSSSAIYNWTTDYTAPSIMFSSVPPKGVDIPDVSFTTSSSESVTYAYMIDGFPAASPDLTGLSEGSHTFTVTATDAAGNSSNIISYTWVYGTIHMALSGGVVGTGSVLNGNSNGDIYADSGGDQAGWNLSLGGSYTGPSTSSWNYVSGGVGMDDVPAFNGYWLSEASGTYSGNLMSGTSNFRYLSETTLGIGTGTVSGSYDSGLGTWSALDNGIYTEVPLAFGSGVGILANNGFVYWNGEGISSDSDITGLTGLMGGTTDLWAGASFSMLGVYENTNERSLWYMDVLTGYDPVLSDLQVNPCDYNIGCQRPTLSGASVADAGFFGGLAGISLNDTLEGFGIAIYIKGPSSGGLYETGYVLTNDIAGVFYPDIAMWDADGTWTVHSMGDGTAISPDQLYDGSPAFGENPAEYGPVGGDISGAINLDPLSLDDQSWGIWRAGLGGTYSVTPLSNWNARFGWSEYYDSCGECWELWGITMAYITGDSWANSRLSGTVNGRLLNLDELTTFNGPLLGTYDLPDADTWQAVSLGAWSATPLLFVTSGSSRLVGSSYLSTASLQYPTTGEFFYTEYYADNSSGYERDYRPTSGSNFAKYFYGDGTWERIDYLSVPPYITYTYGTWVTSNPVNSYFDSDPPGAITGASSYGPDTYTDSYFDYLLGGTDSLWTATAASPASVVMMGEYYPLAAAPHLWDSALDGYYYAYSYDYINYTYKTYDGGAYVAYLDGIDTPTADPAVRYFEGLFYGLYIDPGAYPNAHAGVLKGNLTGNGYTDLNLFEMDGTIFHVEMVDQANDYIAGDLYNIFIEDYINTGGATFNGTFTAGTLSGSLYGPDMISIPGEGWGVSRTSLWGTYSGSTSNNWNAVVDSVYTYPGDPSTAYGNITTGTQWSNNIIKGTFEVYYAKDVTTGIMVGETLGTFSPDTWQATQIGVWMETQKFLDMACPSGVCNTTGSGLTTDQQGLKDLNIPVVEIGRANLYGSGNNIDMTQAVGGMKDVVFFAPSSGAAPIIWATGNVTGSYSGTVVTGTPVSLSGDGLTANFTPQAWDTANGKWLATINGSGSLQTMGAGNALPATYTSPISLKGAGAGTINPTSGTFAGTAAGVAQ